MPCWNAVRTALQYTYRNGDRAPFLDKKLKDYLNKFKKRIKSQDTLEIYYLLHRKLAPMLGLHKMNSGLDTPALCKQNSCHQRDNGRIFPPRCHSQGVIGQY